MPQYAVLLFGPAASAVASDKVVFDTPSLCTGDEIRAGLAEQFPALETHLRVGRLAVNQRFEPGDTQVDPASEVALISMVSGG